MTSAFRSLQRYLVQAPKQLRSGSTRGGVQWQRSRRIRPRETGDSGLVSLLIVFTMSMHFISSFHKDPG